MGQTLILCFNKEKDGLMERILRLYRELTALFSPPVFPPLFQEDDGEFRGLLLLHPVSADFRPAELIHTQGPQGCRQLASVSHAVCAAGEQESPARPNRPSHPGLSHAGDRRTARRCQDCASELNRLRPPPKSEYILPQIKDPLSCVFFFVMQVSPTHTLQSGGPPKSN